VVCPQCQLSNPPGATSCHKCNTPIDLGDATVFEPVEDFVSRSAAGADEGNGQVATVWSKIADQPTADPHGHVSIVPGSVLAGRYEVLQQLGEGGMGAVYKVRDRELDRLVALKVIRPDLARHPEILQRFKRELILARQITHRNVVRIFDLGVSGPTKFITMEYLEGGALNSLMANGKLPPVQAVEILRQVCRGLEVAHGENVIHRDLKPQNIMVDKTGRVSVMDFGLAYSLEDRGMTRTGVLMGTPDYMSPEQAKAEKVDARSDLFSLGVIFYQMLTGKLPFESDTMLGALLARTQQRPTPPASVDPSIPKFLSDVTMKCLAVDLDRRYQSAAELVRDLDAWQESKAGRSRRLRRVRSGPRLRMVAEGNAWKWIAASMAVMLGLVAGTWLLYRPSAKPIAGPAIELAILPFRNASGASSLEWLGPQMAAMLRTDVGQSSSLQTVPSDRVGQILHDLRIGSDSSVDPDTLRRVAEATNADRVLWGQFAKFGNKIHIDATLQDLKRSRSFSLKAIAAQEEDVPRAMEQLAKDVQKKLAFSGAVIKELQATALKPSTHSVRALRYYNEGLELEHQAKNAEALKSFQASVKQDPSFALAYARLGQVYARLGYGNEAEQSARKAIDLGENISPQETYLIAAIRAQTTNNNQKAIEAYENVAKLLPEDPDVQFALAGLYNSVGSFDKAGEYYHKLLARDPKYVEAIYGLAGVEINAGNFQKGLEYLNGALPTTVELGNDQEKSLILYGLGVAYSQLNKPHDALRNYEQALDIQKRLGENRSIAQTLNGMGQVQDALGQSREALKSFQEALRVREELGDKTGVGDTLIDLSNFYNARGQNDQALTMLKRSLQIQREVGNRAYEALCLSNIGANYADKGQYDDALTFLNQALGVREQLKDPTSIADSNYVMADVLTKLGQYDEAITHYLKALDLWRRVNDKRRAAFASHGLGNIFEQQGRVGAALNAQEEALKTIRELQDKIGTADILTSYASALALLGREQEARKNVNEALALAREVKNQSLTGQSLNIQGDISFYQGDFKAAKASYEQALKTVAGTSDRRLILISKFNIAKAAVKLGNSRNVVSDLHTLSLEAEALGLKYISVACSVYMNEGIVDAKDYPLARRELERVLSRSEKLGLKSLQAQSEYLLATALRLSGSSEEAAPHYANARRIVDEMRKEAKSDTLLKRADLGAIYAESAKWSKSPAA
jgi:eukaryotic-like serine/threonine-protein kinase